MKFELYHDAINSTHNYYIELVHTDVQVLYVTMAACHYYYMSVVTFSIIGNGCIHFKQKEWRHGSVLGLVYWSKHTLHVSWSSNCSLKVPRENPPSAISSTVQKAVVITVYYS